MEGLPTLCLHMLCFVGQTALPSTASFPLPQVSLLLVVPCLVTSRLVSRCYEAAIHWSTHVPYHIHNTPLVSGGST